MSVIKLCILQVESVPPELRGLVRWLSWRYSTRPNSAGKFGKVPYNIADKMADYTDRQSWLPLDTVIQQYRRSNYDGIGLVLGDGLCGLDLDHCCSEGRFEREAAWYVEYLNSYSERSVSGDGVHVLAFGSIPPGPRKKGNYELYDAKRYFVFTGVRLSSAPPHVESRNNELHEVHTMIFGQQSQSVRSVTQSFPNTQGGERGVGDLLKSSESCRTDESVIAMLMKDEIGRVYWAGYPEGVNPSRADWALAMKLAFYTGKNLAQMERIFRRAGLFGRRKHSSWRGPVDYVTYTLMRACRCQQAVWHPKPPEENKVGSVGRPLSHTTRSVLELAAQDPSLTCNEIAAMLGIRPGTVRQIKRRHLLFPQVPVL